MVEDAKIQSVTATNEVSETDSPHINYMTATYKQQSNDTYVII